MKDLRILVALMLFSSTLHCHAQALKFPVRDPEPLTPRYALDYWGKLEISGIVKSRNSNNTFWIHNDSGDQPRLFALDSTGNFIQSERYKNYEGISIAGTTNVDWEDVAVDDKGNIIIADIGNNGNDRKDLVLYFIPEPSPTASNTTFLKKIFIKYPDQKAFPDKTDLNYDSEAIFIADGRVHILSKNRSDTFTKLYRVDKQAADEINVLTFLDKFNVDGQVTAADASGDGKRLLLITYTAIWLFERQTSQASFFNGSVWWLPVTGPQIESVCFKDDKTIWIVDEVTASLYEIPVSRLVKLR